MGSHHRCTLLTLAACAQALAPAALAREALVNYRANDERIPADKVLAKVLRTNPCTDAERRAAADLTRRAALEKALAPEPDGPGVLVKLRCPDGSTATRKFATDAPAGALLDWCDVRGVDLEAFVVRKAAGDRVVLDDRTSLLGDVLGARALLECVER